MALKVLRIEAKLGEIWGFRTSFLPAGIRPSSCVCLSHAGIVSKRLNVGSRKQRHSNILTSTVVGGRSPILPEICAQSDPPLSKTTISTNIRL